VTGKETATVQSFPHTVCMDDLMEYRNAVHYFRSLDVLDRKDVAGIRHGCENLVMAVQCGLKQADGLAKYPSLLEMDSAKGEAWTNHIKRPADFTESKTCIRGIAAKYRGIHDFIEKNVPYGAVGSRLEKAIKVARIFDQSREKGFSLSAWWDLHKANEAALSKTSELRKTMLASEVLTSEEKETMTNLLDCVHALVEKEKTSVQLKAGKELGNRQVYPAAIAYKKALTEYEELMSNKQLPLSSVGNNDERVQPSLVAAVSTPGITLCNSKLVPEREL